MKKNYILFAIFCFANVAIHAQDIPYTFDTDEEGWVRIPSGTTIVSASGGILEVGTDVSNFGGVTSPELTINESNYNFVEVVMENNATITDFQLLNYVTGGTNGGSATKTNFSVPSSPGFNTYLIPMPASPNAAGAITMIGIRIMGDPAASENFKFESITIKSAVPATYNGFVENADFEDVNGSLGAWSLTGLGATTVAVSNDANSGTQAAEFLFSDVVSTNPNVLWNNYRWSITPLSISNAESVTVTWDMKKINDTGDAILVQVAPRWRMNIVSGGTGDRIIFGAAQAVTNTYATYSVTKTISETPANDGETYDDIELGMAARDGSAGIAVVIDNIVSSITGTTLGIEDVNFIDDKSISLFPNPASDVLTINSPLKIVGLKVINVLGQVNIIQNGRSNTLNVSTLSDGVYILKIVQENGTISTKRFLKN